MTHSVSKARRNLRQRNSLDGGERVLRETLIRK